MINSAQPTPESNPLPTFHELTLDDIQFTGEEYTVDDFKELLEALEAKFKRAQSEPQSENPPLLFSQSTKAKNKTPILFLDFDGVCWVDDVDRVHQRYRALKQNYDLKELIKQHMPMLREAYDFEDVEEFFKFACFDRNNMQRIGELCKEFNARIVVTSSWRNGRNNTHLNNLLDLWGIQNRVIGKTDDGHCFSRRSLEINRWLTQNSDIVDGYIILDDQYYEQLTHLFHEKFIWCDGNKAFDEPTYQQARQCLQAQLTPSNDNTVSAAGPSDPTNEQENSPHSAHLHRLK